MLRSILASLLGALGLALPLALAGAAPAQTLHASSVLSVDGKLSCYGTVPAEGRKVVCNTPALGRRDGMLRYLELKATGSAKIVARGDYGGYSARPTTIRLGDSWVWRGIRCSYGSMGITCHNASGHGFRMDEVSFTRH
jgi:hypothetical protein